MQQQKREHKKIVIDPLEKAGGNALRQHKLMPGVRPDNRWLQYTLDALPRNQQQWDEPRFVHKTEGFFGWSPNFSVYAPSAEQPPLNRTRDELTSSERIVYDFFANRANVDKLIAFWSLEEKKVNTREQRKPKIRNYIEGHVIFSRVRKDLIEAVHFC